MAIMARWRMPPENWCLGPADVLKVGAAHGEQVPALEQRGAADPGATGDAHDGLSRHALARARLADNAEGLPGVHVEREAADGLHDAVRRAK